MFDELSTEEWAKIAPLVADEQPGFRGRGRPRADARATANALLWIVTTGKPWSQLPAGYPCGQTCRRRFDQWLTDGRFCEMINVLSQGGRAFAHLPQPVAPPVAKRIPTPEPSGPQGAFWANLEFWRTATSPARAHNGLSSEHARADSPSRFDTPVEKRTDEYCGYLIHAVSERITREAMTSFRASAEIVKDGRRLERSGLIGPRFPNCESAQRYALEWARDWLDRHTRATTVRLYAGPAHPAQPEKRLAGCRSAP